MGLKSLLAIVGFTFTLILPSVVAEPATLPFNDCFSGDTSHKLQISTVYGQILTDRYLNLTILGNTSIQIVSANNNTNEPVASTCLPNSFIFPRIASRYGFADPADSLLSYALHDHRPTHVQRMEQRILLLRHTSPSFTTSRPGRGFQQQLLSPNVRTLRILDSLETSAGLRTRHLQHPPTRFRP